MQKWEYYWTELRNVELEEINQKGKKEKVGRKCGFWDGRRLELSEFLSMVGDAGWEMAGVEGGDIHTNTTLFFKRPRP